MTDPKKPDLLEAAMEASCWLVGVPTDPDPEVAHVRAKLEAAIAAEREQRQVVWAVVRAAVLLEDADYAEKEFWVRIDALKEAVDALPAAVREELSRNMEEAE